MFGSQKGSPKFYFGGHLLGLGISAKMHGSAKGSLNMFFRAQPCTLFLHAIVECGSAFIEDISKAGMEILVNYPILLTYMVVILM